MLNNTIGEYVFIRGCIIFLRSIAPLSIIYSLSVACGLQTSFRLPWYGEYVTFAETIFYAVFFLYRKLYLQRPAVHPPLYNEQTRRQLVERCFSLIPDYDHYVSTWFLGAPPDAVKKGNIEEFFRWAFFNSADPDPEFEDELQDYVKVFEQARGRQFEPGRSNIKCLRLTLDKVNILHRSLIWYLCVSFVDNLNYVLLLSNGFRFHRMSLFSTFKVFPPRLQTLVATRESPVPDLSYWYRPHTSRRRLPVLFLHGIGIGLYPYTRFIADLKQLDDEGQIGVIAIEIMPISFRLTGEAISKDVQCEQIQKILEHHGYDEFVLVSHSYGSIITTHLLRDAEVSHRVASMVIIDPISILLHHPSVAYNMLVRQPKSAAEWQLWYFASRDAGVAHTLNRRFFWFENILWKEDMADRPTTVFLSERDLLVNTSDVRSYLLGSEVTEEEHKEDDSFQKPRQQDQIRVVWCANLDHGQVFETKRWRARLMDEVRKVSSKRGKAITTDN